MMFDDSTITIQRNCEVTLIPYGARIQLKGGDQVKITQALGDSYTLLFKGNLFRLEGKDADAIGKERTDHKWKKDGQVEFRKEMVWDILKTCYDPEIPINIVDLGLIYSCESSDTLDGVDVSISMTLTAPGCGMGGILADDVKERVLGLPGVKNCNVQLVWEPQWNKDMMSEGAKLQLGLL